MPSLKKARGLFDKGFSHAVLRGRISLLPVVTHLRRMREALGRDKAARPKDIFAAQHAILAAINQVVTQHEAGIAKRAKNLRVMTPALSKARCQGGVHRCCGA